MTANKTKTEKKHTLTHTKFQTFFVWKQKKNRCCLLSECESDYIKLVKFVASNFLEEIHYFIQVFPQFWLCHSDCGLSHISKNQFFEILRCVLCCAVESLMQLHLKLFCKSSEDWIFFISAKKERKKSVFATQNTLQIRSWL